MNLFKRTKSYRFHLSSGSYVDLTHVKTLETKWNADTLKLVSYHVAHTAARFNTLHHIVLNDVVAIELLR